MGEMRGYTCDGGCGATAVMTVTDSLARIGWFTIYTPPGVGTLHCCSIECSVAALNRSALHPALNRPTPETL